MEKFANKKVVLAVSGGIAAYKAADVASWLTKNGAQVHCVLTKAATEFVSPFGFAVFNRSSCGAG